MNESVSPPEKWCKESKAIYIIGLLCYGGPLSLSIGGWVRILEERVRFLSSGE